MLCDAVAIQYSGTSARMIFRLASPGVRWASLVRAGVRRSRAGRASRAHRARRARAHGTAGRRASGVRALLRCRRAVRCMRCALCSCVCLLRATSPVCTALALASPQGRRFHQAQAHPGTRPGSREAQGPQGRQGHLGPACRGGALGAGRRGRRGRRVRPAALELPALSPPAQRAQQWPAISRPTPATPIHHPLESAGSTMAVPTDMAMMFGELRLRLRAEGSLERPCVDTHYCSHEPAPCAADRTSTSSPEQ